MMNIQNAVCQMRIARKLGKISNEIQTRTMRRLGVNWLAHWETMMKLRASIAREIAPQLHAKRVAERECYDIKYSVEPESRTAKLVNVKTRKVRRELTGYEYTPEWWDDAEKRERAERKSAKTAGVAVEVE